MSEKRPEDNVLIVVRSERFASEYNRFSVSKDVKYVAPGWFSMGYKCGTLISLIDPDSLKPGVREKYLDWFHLISGCVVSNGVIVR